MTTENETVLSLTRIFNADIQRVYDAWTVAENVCRWMGPSDDFDPRIEEWNATVGGRYRMNLWHPETGDHWVEGTFLELESPSRIVLTWQWDYADAPSNEMTIEINLKMVGERTEFSMTHSRLLDAKQRDSHSIGWQGSFERMERYLAETSASA